MTTPKPIIREAWQLAQVFTAPNNLRYMQQKFFEGGMKAIEAFENDIRYNLEAWATDGKAIAYLTPEYWYLAELKDEQGCPIVYLTRFSRTSWMRWDTWMNKHSFGSGKEWLLQEPQKSKRTTMFHDGRKAQ